VCFLGEFHWHKHDIEDEFFHVVSGRLIIDLEGRTIELHQGRALLFREVLCTAPGRPSEPLP